MIENYLNSRLLSSINGIEHYFGKRDFIFPNLEKVYFLNQLHSDKVISVSDDFDCNEQKDGDAIITSKRNQTIIIQIIQIIHKIIKKHVRKNQDQPQGEIVEREGTIHWSNVMQTERYEKNHKIDSPALETEKETEKETAKEE